MRVVHEARFRFEHGDHACIFYQSEDSLADVLIPYIIEGLQKQEKCLCVQSPEMLKRIEVELRQRGFDFDKEVRSGALQLMDGPQRYLSGEKFRPTAIVEATVKSLEECKRLGFSGFRGSGDLSWAAEARVAAKDILEYEHAVGKCFQNYPFTGLCQYSIKSFPKKTVSEILRAHRIHVVDPSPPSASSWIQIRNKNFVAEIITDKASEDKSYSYIVRRTDSKDVLGYGNAPSFASAKARAERLLRRVSSGKDGVASHRKSN
jgi:hypothetical protein